MTAVMPNVNTIGAITAPAFVFEPIEEMGRDFTAFVVTPMRKALTNGMFNDVWGAEIRPDGFD